MKVKDMSDRVGKLKIDIDYLRSLDIELAQELNSKIIVLNAENDFVSNKVIYTAISEEFEKTEVGQMPPVYTVKIEEISKENSEKSEYKINFVK